MRAITVKGIPDDLYESLKHSAKMNRRSINSEIIVCIGRALRSYPLNPEAVLETARRLRAQTAAHPISDAEFSEAKRTGRP